MYFIFDEADGKGYVGSAYGGDNSAWALAKLCRPQGTAGTACFRQRDPKSLRFTILQRVSPDMERDDVIRLEATWKDRLHTRKPHGLNEN